MNTVCICFDEFRLDVMRVELRRGGRLVELEPRVFDLLLYLLRHRDRVVSRDDLIAEVWRGRLVSESTLSSHVATLRCALGDDGTRQRLIRTARRKGYRFVGAVREFEAMPPAERVSEPTATVRTTPARAVCEPAFRSSAARPVVCLLSFRNLSPDERLGRFIEGVVEDLATTLASHTGLQVLPPSAGDPCGAVASPAPAGSEPTAGYLVGGSVRGTSAALRITARLVDTRSGVQLWARGFDLRAGELLQMQDRVTAGIIGSLVPQLEQAEIERIRRKALEEPDAYELYVRGMSRAFQWTEQGMRDALVLLHRALDRDPGFAPASAMAAYCYVQRKSYGWVTDRDADVAACEQLASLCVQARQDDAVALARAAHALAYVVDDIDGGIALVEQSRALNPGLALAWYVSGWLQLFIGRTDEAMDHLQTALRLSPFDPLAFKMHAAIAYARFLEARYDEACWSASWAMRARPNYLTAMRGAAAAHALGGRTEEARRLMTRIRERDATLRASTLGTLMPFRHRADFERWSEGLQRAGLPA